MRAVETPPSDQLTRPRPSLTATPRRATLTAVGGALVGLLLAPVIFAVPLMPIVMIGLLIGSWNAWHHEGARQDAWRTVFVVTVAAVSIIVAFFVFATVATAFTDADVPPAP